MAFAGTTTVKRCGCCGNPEKFFKMLTSVWPEDAEDEALVIQDDPFYTGPRNGVVFSNQRTGYMGEESIQDLCGL